jgi:hypothetical protein
VRKRRDMSDGVEARIGARLKLPVEQYVAQGQRDLVERRSLKKLRTHWCS